MKEKLLAYIEKEKLDAFYIHRPENVRYISGYSGGDAYLLILPHIQYLISDPRCLEHAQSECPDFECVDWRPLGSIPAGLAHFMEKENVHTVGCEADCLNIQFYQDIQKLYPCQMVPTEGVIEAFRTVKTAKEIQDIRTACDISSKAFNYICDYIRPGVTEKELEARLAAYMQSNGAHVKTSPNIVISGAKTSMLHGTPSMKAVEHGDLVLMDYGCKYNGYTADMTRTVVVGRATDRQKEIYGYVQKMLEAGLAAAGPGVGAEAIHDAALQVIENTEYPPYFYHSIGHGFGLFVHESPFVRPGSPDVLQAGNTMTIEPGIYIPGWGGIRIEDDILVTEDGIENLISAPHDLIELF